ncbi:hypothetical protein V8G54_006699 [Vigna mungo]|uniref:Uncharacterized protein n=1 Tax=Vigna mungo TaxID=3915 RepID=A0AAQ3P2D7_VIGMU
MESPHSVNSPRRTLSLSKQRRATVSFLDPDDKTSGFGLSGDHGPKPSEVYGFVGSITTVVATAVPTYVMVTIILMLGFYIGLNFISTPSPSSLNTVFGEFDAKFFSDTRDPLSNECSLEDEKPIDPISDIGLDRINDSHISLNPIMMGIAIKQVLLIWVIVGEAIATEIRKRPLCLYGQYYVSDSCPRIVVVFVHMAHSPWNYEASAYRR